MLPPIRLEFGVTLDTLLQLLAMQSAEMFPLETSKTGDWMEFLGDGTLE